MIRRRCRPQSFFIPANHPVEEQILRIAGRARRYVQLQYTPVLGKRIKKYFGEVKLKFVPQNLPPAFIYVCKNSIDGAR